MATTSALAELSQFMVERLTELDPTLSTAAGSRIYTVVINPLLSRLGQDPMATDVETFILQRMRDVYPDLDVTSPGSVIRDVFVSPLIMLLTPLREEIAHLRRQQSLADYESLSEVEMDALLANVLSARSTGSYAYGTVRVFFSTTRVVGIDSSITFTTSIGQVFVADDSRQYLPSEMVRQGNLWYIEVPVRSFTPATNANVAAGTAFTVEGVDGVVRAANPKAIDGGVSAETNTQFYERALNAISERSLNTERGIQNFITDTSTNIVSVDVVGFGDPLMNRDVLTASGAITITGVPGGVPFPAVTGTSISVNPNEVHIGGATDVYIKTGQTSSQVAAGIQATSDTITAVVKIVSITAGSNVVTSTGLGTALGYAGTTILPAGTYTLELENLDDSGVTPLAVKVVAVTGADTVRVDSAFAGFAGVMAGVRARLQTSVAIDLGVPKVVLQEGTANTTAGSPTLVLVPPSTNTFINDPANESIYLEIIGTAAAGEYRVVTKLANQLILDRQLGHTLSGASYRVYIKQASQLAFPVTQLTSVTISSGSTGVDIPYADPVHVALTAPASRLPAPITFSDVGECGVAGTTLTCTAPNSFSGLGLLAGDIVYLPELAQPYFYISSVGVPNAQTIELTAPIVGGPITSTLFKIGSATISTAQMTFMAPTFFAAKYREVYFSHTTASGETYQFSPAKNAYGYIYGPTDLETPFTLDGVTTKILAASGYDFHDMGIKVGDVVEVQSLVLASGLFSAVEDANVDIAGVPNVGLSVLKVTVDGTDKLLYFPQINPSLTSIVSVFNQQLGSDLFAERVTNGADKQLLIYSRKHIVLANHTGSPLTHLKLSSATDNQPAGVSGDFSISAMASDGTYLTLASGLAAGAVNQRLLLQIKRLGTQFLFPLNMAQQDNGLYTGTVQVESRIPIANGTVITNAECTVTGHTSKYGYTFYVANPEYAFSMGERLFLTLSNLVLPSTAFSLDQALVVPKTSLTIEYENAPEVDILQQTMLRRSLRVVCNNPLVKYYQPAYPVFGIRYQGLEEVDDVRTKLLDLIVRLYPNNPLEVYDVMAELGKLRVDNVVGPLEVGYLTIDKNRVLRLFKSFNQVPLDRSFHVMGELDYVTVTRG